MELGYVQVQAWHQGTISRVCDFRHNLYILENYFNASFYISVSLPVQYVPYHLFSVCEETI